MCQATTGKPADVEVCALVATELRGDAVSRLVLAAVATAAALAVFDWTLTAVLTGSAVGAAVWGAQEYATETRHRVPRGELVHTALPVAAAHARRLRDLPGVLLAAALVAGAAWLADRWALGAVFIPGQLFGYACADLVGLMHVLRWEQTNGTAVVVTYDGDGDPNLYAAARETTAQLSA